MKLTILRNMYRFADRKIILQAHLQTRNSQTYQVIIRKSLNEKIQIQVPKTATLAHLKKEFQVKIEMTNLQLFCNEKAQLLESTPIDVLINRCFFVTCDQFQMFQVTGEQMGFQKVNQVVEGIVGLQLPAVTRKDVQNYISRVNQWVQFKSGKSILDQSLQIQAKEVSQIFVDAAIEPKPIQRRILQVQAQWEKLYWALTDLKKKKEEADQKCLQSVRLRMSMGLLLLGGNIGFIWSGTYVFYSWDIIQPLAYFISSAGTIVLAGQFFKLGKPYTNYVYQKYLMDKISPKIYKQSGFSMQQMTNIENKLIILQSIIKDYYLKRL